MLDFVLGDYEAVHKTTMKKCNSKTPNTVAWVQRLPCAHSTENTSSHAEEHQHYGCILSIKKRERQFYVYKVLLYLQDTLETWCNFYTRPNSKENTLMKYISCYLNTCTLLPGGMKRRPFLLKSSIFLPQALER